MGIFSGLKEKLGQFGELVETQQKALESKNTAQRVQGLLQQKQAEQAAKPTQIVSPTKPSTGNIFTDIKQNIIKPITPPNLIGGFKPAPQASRALESARKLGEEVKERAGGAFGKVAEAVPKATFRTLEGISQAAGGAIRGTLKPQPGETLGKVLERQPFLSQVVEEEVRKTPVIGKIPGFAPVAGFVSEFLLPPYGGAAGKTRFIKALTKEGDIAASKLLLKQGIKDISEEEAEALARRTAPLRDKAAIEKEITTFEESRAKLREVPKPKEEPITKRIEEPTPKRRIEEPIPKRVPEVTPIPKGVNVFEGIKKPPEAGIPTPEAPVRPPEITPKPPEITPVPPETPITPTPTPEAPVAPKLPEEVPVAEGARPFERPAAGEGIGVLPSEAKAVSERFPSRLVERKFLTSVKKTFPEVGEKIQKVGGQYVPRSTDELAIKARSLVKSNLDDAENLARAGSDENAVATASELIKHYNEVAEQSGKLNAPIFYEKAADIAHNMAAKLTEQGRSVQAASILSRLTPEGMLRFAASEVNKYNQGLAKSRGLLGLKRTVPQLTAEQSGFILKEAKRIQGMADGVEKAMAFRKLNDVIADLVPTPLYKKLITLWKAGLLTGLKTSGLNTFSNLFHGFSEILKDIPAAGIDSVASLLTGKRTLAFTPKGYLKGVKEGFNKGLRYLKTGFDERDVATKLDHRRVNFGTSKFAKGIQAYTDTVFRVLGSEDQPFYYGAKARSLESQAIAQAKNQGLKGAEAKSFIDNVIENPTDEMLKYAVMDAETAVFQNRTVLGDIAKAVQRAPGGEVIVPFGRTPSAVATQVLNYTPIGAVKTIVQNIGRGRFDQRAFSQGLARGLAGTGVMFVGFELLNNGLMTLGRPTTEREQKLWELEGRSANSIKIGDKWRSVQVLGPAGNVLLIGGYFADAMKREGSPTKAMAEAVAGGAKSFTEQTFLRGINQAVDALTDPQRSFEVFFTNLAGSTVPTLVADIARSADVSERRISGPAEKLKSRIPFLRESLEPAITALGGDVPRYGGNVLESMIDPTRPSVIKGDEVVEELRRLWGENQKVAPTLLGDKKGYEGLTPEQNTELWEKTGQLVDSKLRNLFKLPAYQKLDDEGKGKAVESIVDKSKTLSRAAMVMEITQELQGDELKTKLSELKKSGLLTKAVLDKYIELR